MRTSFCIFFGELKRQKILLWQAVVSMFLLQNKGQNDETIKHSVLIIVMILDELRYPYCF